MPSDLRLAIDIGGTFTDTVLLTADHTICATAKTPTTSEAPALGALAGATRVLADAQARLEDVSSFIHGTTLATNALIERRGAKVATITTAGFRDILEIAYERRYSQYAINIDKPDLRVPRARALTIGGRMSAQGDVLEPLDRSAVPALAEALTGVEAVAICLLHAYANPAHELELRDLLQEACPGLVISLSHEVSPEAREFDRLCTTIANAYVQPLMADYLSDFQARFEAAGLTCDILLMTAGGGMTTLTTAARLPIRLLESGPAGGAILAARIAEETGSGDVLSFDMGGTTAKLCLVDDYQPQTARSFEISRAERFLKGSGMPVRIPVIEMIEIGAGGGSIASVDRLGRLQVGPQSAGSDPGPAGFAKGGTAATVTDADIALGYIDPVRFAEGRLQIDPQASRQALEGLLLEGAAYGVSDIVDENMASAGRMHAVESGKDLGARLMIAFGGNGPLHATRVARRAGVTRILIPNDPGVGSALGFLFAPVSFEIVRSYYARLAHLNFDALNAVFDAMIGEAEAVVRAGAAQAPLTCTRVAFMRYHGQGHEIEITLPDRPLRPSDLADLTTRFETAYRQQFHRAVPGMDIEILNWSVRVSSPRPDLSYTDPMPPPRPCAAPTHRSITCDLKGTEQSAGVFERSALRPGDLVAGPALIIEPQTTTLVSTDFTAQCDTRHNLWLTRREETRP